MREYFLFDLDGTLTDPGVGITRSVSYALEHFGIETGDLSELYPYIGPPLRYSFAEFHGIPESQLETALELYRERFSKLGIFENEPYAGIAELLAELKRHGAKIMLATSKPEEFASEILRHFKLDAYFDFVGGNTLDEARPEKADVIEHVMQQNPGITRENSIMIGDRSYDILGAHKLGLEAVGVLYGYGSRQELEACGAEYIAESVEDLRGIITKIR